MTADEARHTEKAGSQMARLVSTLALALPLALAACGGGGTTTGSAIPAAPQTKSYVSLKSIAHTTNPIPPANGQAFTLATCVPVLNAGDTIANGTDTLFAQVGTACAGIAPAQAWPQQAGAPNGLAPIAAPASPSYFFTVNGRTSISCQPVGYPSYAASLDGFSCDGNPYS